MAPVGVLGPEVTLHQFLALLHITCLIAEHEVIQASTQGRQGQSAKASLYTMRSQLFTKDSVRQPDSAKQPEDLLYGPEGMIRTTLDEGANSMRHNQVLRALAMLR